VGSNVLEKPIPTIVGEETSVHYITPDISEDGNYRIGKIS
jgi:hypothetical protein